jgi:hypothetical protein
MPLSFVLDPGCLEPALRAYSAQRQRTCEVGCGGCCTSVLAFSLPKKGATEQLALQLTRADARDAG